jgi:hypothetical protein
MPEVIIDGVRYVPAVEASPGAKDLMRALVASWWGWSKDIDADVAQYAGVLRVVVSEEDIDDDGQTLEEFIADLLQHMHGADIG